MFWRKKKLTATPVEASPAGTGTAMVDAIPVAAREEKPAVAKAGKEMTEKLPGPKSIPEILGNYLIKHMNEEPGRVWRLSAVMRPRSAGEKGFDVRVFSDTEADTNNVKVKNYTTLDQYPKLVLFEGWFDKESKKVELKEKRTIQKVTIYSEKEILQQIEALSEPGSKVFFYLNASPASGGPLGRGAALVELNPKYPGKGEKKYSLSAVPVVNEELSSKGLKMSNTDKAKDIARWIKERHFKSSMY